VDAAISPLLEAGPGQNHYNGDEDDERGARSSSPSAATRLFRRRTLRPYQATASSLGGRRGVGKWREGWVYWGVAGRIWGPRLDVRLG
jgi:hypothetical protein